MITGLEIIDYESARQTFRAEHDKFKTACIDYCAMNHDLFMEASKNYYAALSAFNAVKDEVIRANAK